MYWSTWYFRTARFLGMLVSLHLYTSRCTMSRSEQAQLARLQGTLQRAGILGIATFSCFKIRGLNPLNPTFMVLIRALLLNPIMLRSEVAQLARLHDILLRAGSLCNPGAAALHLGYSAAQLAAHAAAGGGCGSGADLIEGRIPAGAARVSFGWGSAYEDAAAVLRFVRGCFVEGGVQETPTLAPDAAAAAAPAAVTSVENGPEVLQQGLEVNMAKSGEASGPSTAQPSSLPAAEVGAGRGGERPAMDQLMEAVPDLGHMAAASANIPPQDSGASRAMDPKPYRPGSAAAGARDPASGGGAHLTAIYVYPIKSCAAFQARSWPLGPNGLLLDREWALVGADGAALTLRQAPRMAAVRPSVDLAAGALCSPAAAILRCIQGRMCNPASSSYVARLLRPAQFCLLYKTRKFMAWQ